MGYAPYHWDPENARHMVSMPVEIMEDMKHKLPFRVHEERAYAPTNRKMGVDLIPDIYWHHLKYMGFKYDLSDLKDLYFLARSKQARFTPCENGPSCTITDPDHLVEFLPYLEKLNIQSPNHHAS